MLLPARCVARLQQPKSFSSYSIQPPARAARDKSSMVPPPPPPPGGVIPGRGELL